MKTPLKILWVSDSPLLGTGFGRATREVVSRLARTPGFEVACLGWGYDIVTLLRWSGNTPSPGGT